MSEAFICAYKRTAIGRFGGALSAVRPDDLGAVALRALMVECTSVDWEAVDDVIFGCANQAGEDNRNVARMSLLLAGLPVSVTGTTVNRLCGSGLDAVITAARHIRAGEAELMIAGRTDAMR
nr:3-oxoadipyl-CoA thiolase [Reyranella sp.]